MTYLSATTILASVPLPPRKLPGFIFTGALLFVFIAWAVIVGVIAYRARGDSDTLHGGAWGETGPWQPPVPQYAPQGRPPQGLPPQAQSGYSVSVRSVQGPPPGTPQASPQQPPPATQTPPS